MIELRDEKTREDFQRVTHWRESERRHMIEAVTEMIDEARTKAKSKRAPANERIRWTRLAGQLIWYKDSIPKSMTLEALEREVSELKKKVFGNKPEEKTAWENIRFRQPNPPQSTSNASK